MLSTFSASDGLFAIPFSDFEGGFTAWDCQGPSFDFQQQDPIFCPQEPVLSKSGSDNSNPIIPLSQNSGSNEPNQNNTNSSSGSDKSNREFSVIDERKRRRMISNRESARRSRMRKQKHVENLRNQLNQLKVSNRELMNRLRLATRHWNVVRNDNDRLRSEAIILRGKLWDIRQVLLVTQIQQQLASSSAWPWNTVTCINEQIPQSLIT